MAAPSRGSKKKSFPVRFRGKRCGSLELTVDDVHGSIEKAFAGLFAASRRIADHYTATAPRASVSARPDVMARDTWVRESVDYVMGHVGGHASRLVENVVWEWLESRLGDEHFWRLIENGALDVGSRHLHSFLSRIAATGTPEEKRRLAALLRRRVAGVRSGPRPVQRLLDVALVDANLDAVRDAVRALRSHDDGDPLDSLRRKLFPGAAKWRVENEVKKARRGNQAVERIVGRALDVGRDRARRIIQDIGKQRARRATGISG